MSFVEFTLAWHPPLSTILHEVSKYPRRVVCFYAHLSLYQIHRIGFWNKGILWLVLSLTEELWLCSLRYFRQKRCNLCACSEENWFQVIEDLFSRETSVTMIHNYHYIVIIIIIGLEIGLNHQNMTDISVTTYSTTTIIFDP